MIEELLRIYEESCLNDGQPKSSFNPTLIFNEGWLLRALMRKWKLTPSPSSLPFLPFPAEATIYSEGQLYTPFVPHYRGDQVGESHTHADGIAGSFSIGGTKSGIEVHADCRYLAEFEAKLYSPIASGITHARGYNQLSRTLACVIHSLLHAGCPLPCDSHVAVLYPAGNRKIRPEEFSKDRLAQKIAARIEQYGLDPATPFALGWRAVLDTIQLSFVTWESALEECQDAQLHQFYELCKRYYGSKSPVGE